MSDRLRDGTQDNPVWRLFNQQRSAARYAEAFADIGGLAHPAVGCDANLNSHGKAPDLRRRM